MRSSFLSLAAVGAIAVLVSAFRPTSASAMATQFQPRSNPLEPFVILDQNGTSVQQTAQPQTVLVTAPNGGETLRPGSRVWITWDSTGRAMEFVHITYSTDDGATTTTIAKGIPNTGSYAWRVPDVYAPHAFVRVDVTDLASVLASDRSDADFVIDGTRPMAPSPVTGAAEVITDVEPGDIVQSPSFATVYAIDGDGTRRPFDVPGVLETYDVADEAIAVVTDATLPTIPLGVPMLPKPGVALVQFPFARTVYAVEGSGSYAILRPLHSEAIAAAMYGEEWKLYVWMLPEGYRHFYHGGSEIVTVFEVDTTILRRADAITQ